MRFFLLDSMTWSRGLRPALADNVRVSVTRRDDDVSSSSAGSPRMAPGPFDSDGVWHFGVVCPVTRAVASVDIRSDRPRCPSCGGVHNIHYLQRVMPDWFDGWDRDAL